MALRLYFTDLVSSFGAGSRWLSTRTGQSSVNAITTTTASGTLIPVTATAGGQALTWFTGPVVNGPFLIPNVASVNLRGFESAASVNAGFGITIQTVDAAGTVVAAALTNASVPTTITELGTADAVKTQTNITTTAADIPIGGRMKITINIKNVGTMGAGTATFSYNSGTIVAAAGNSFITFNDDSVIFDEPFDVRPFEIYGSNGYRG